jgi:hypothetical protein
MVYHAYSILSAVFKAEFCILTPFDITSLFESAFSRHRDFSESLRIMRERLLAGLKNPQLVYFQEDIELSKIAFIVQCSNWAAPALLQRNPSSTLPKYAE